MRPPTSANTNDIEVFERPARDFQDPLKVNFDSIPLPLQQRRRWVGWKYERVGDQLKKPPYQVNGHKASPTNPDTWSTFEQVRAAYEGGSFDGIGIVLASEDRLIAFDLDHCVDEEGTIGPTAQRAVEDLNSYTEFSPSGRGLRILTIGRLPAGPRKQGAFEVYDSGRYVTITGNHVLATPTHVIEAPEATLAVYTRLLLGRDESPEGVFLSDNAVLDRALAGRNAERVGALWNGDWSPYRSQSEADLALCSFIAYECDGDAGIVDRLFRRSALYREKWDDRHFGNGTTYGEATVAKAVADVKPESVSLPVTVNEVPADWYSLFLPPSAVCAAAADTAEWFVSGLIGSGILTEIDGKAKVAGKTTFLLEIVRCFATGEAFLGLDTKPTRVVYLTEQSASSLAAALLRGGVANADEWLRVLSYHAVRAIEWPVLIDLATRAATRFGAKVVVVDTIGQFAGLKGEAENNAGDAYAALAPLQKAAGDGLAVVFVRHERKAGGEPGDAGRGSSAWTAAVDIVVSIRRPEGQHPWNRRQLKTLSRFDETPSDLLFERDESFRYRALGSSAQASAQELDKAVLELVTTTPGLTIEAIIAALQNQGESRATRTAVQAALKRLTDSLAVMKDGAGKAHHPYTYHPHVGGVSDD